MKTENCIFIQNNNKEEIQSDRTIEYYALLGNHDYIDKNNKPRTESETKNTLAKTVFHNNTKKFYVKVGAYGRIFNPMGMFSEGKSNKFIAKVGKNEFDFKQVDQKIFDMYLNFLSTKNLAWLNNAEREMI